MRIAGMLLALAALAGCATTTTVAAIDWPTRYTKVGVSREQLQTDGVDCRWNAEGERTGRGASYWRAGIPGLVSPIPTAASQDACMQAKGYAITP